MDAATTGSGKGYLTTAIRLTIGAALIAATVAAIGETFSTANSIRSDAARSSDAAQRQVARELGLDPKVFDQIASDIPPRAAYDLTIDPRIGRSTPGHGFAALLRSDLLPRVDVAGGSAVWHVSWGKALRPNCCRHVVDAGLVHRGDPPVLVFRDG